MLFYFRKNVSQASVALVIATLSCSVLCQTPTAPEVTENIRTSLSYSPEGQVCHAVVADCAGPRILKRSGFVHGMVDLLAPKADRGAKLDQKGMLGNCMDFHVEDYEKVWIFFNDDFCGKNSAIIKWKERSCTYEESTVKTDLCGEQFSRSLSRQLDLAISLDAAARALENQASRQSDQESKDFLMQQAQIVRLQASRLKSSFEELTKQPEHPAHLWNLLH